MAEILNALEISARGLTVQRKKMNTSAENLANAETTRTREGGPYRRQEVVVSEESARTGFRTLVKEAGMRLAQTNKHHLPSRGHRLREGVEISAVSAEQIQDPDTQFKIVHDPTHPDADEEGFVRMPNVEVVTEMVDMMAASRAYEANTVAIAAAKKMAKDALDI
jgi:flagellar basal-body rod protein FlgC